MITVRQILSNPVFKTLLVLASGNFLSSVIRGIAALIQARWIDPETAGEFMKYGILTGYLVVGLVFVHDALMRQYPYLLGKGEKEEALQCVSAAKWWYMMLSYLFSSLFTALAIYSVFLDEWRAVAGWLVQIPIVWLTFYGAYLGVLYRTSNEFQRLSANSVIVSIIGFVLLAPVKWYGYWGMCLRVSLQAIADIYLNHRFAPLHIRSHFNFNSLKSLAKMSIPLSIPGYINTSLMTATISFIIVQSLGERSLGLYGIALTFQAMAATMTSALNQMYWPRIAAKYGETHSVLACFRFSIKPALANLAAGVAAAGVLCMTVGYFIEILTPKYIDAISVTRILSIWIPIFAIGLPLTILTISLRYKVLFFLSIVKFIFLLTLINLLPKTLNMIAMSLVLSSLLSMIIGYLFLFYFCTKEKTTLIRS